MALSFYPIDLAGPGKRTSADTDSRYTHQAVIKPSSITLPRRVKVSAVGTRIADGREVTTYKVEEIYSHQQPQTSSPPLLSRRRSRSQVSICSDNSPLLTPSPSVFGSTASTTTSPLTPLGMPRMLFLRSSQTSPTSPSSARSLSRQQNLDLGLDLGGYMHKRRYEHLCVHDFGWSIDSINRNAKSGPQSFEPSAPQADEESYYHLPSNLFSPELEMSETQFRELVIRWSERRKVRKAEEHKDSRL
jgi:hypothetical protein